MSARTILLGTLAAALLCGTTVLLGERQACAETALKADPAAAEINPKALGAVKVVGSGFKPRTVSRSPSSRQTRGRTSPSPLRRRTRRGRSRPR